MARHRIHTRAPRGDLRRPVIVRDPDVLAALIEDAAHFPGGHAAGVVSPSTEAEVAAALATGEPVLPVGAQSSLTGGATPMGELLLSTSRFSSLEIGSGHVRAGAGVTLAELDRALAGRGLYYPPAPTFAGASVGGTIATNAAGAATFKYGTTRDWVEALTIVLPSGDVIDVARGEVCASSGGEFEIVTPRGALRVPIPRYTMPEVPKISAGYFARPAMDLVDLFIGSEGTLGIVTAATLKVVSPRPAPCLALVPFDEEARAMAFVRRLRRAAQETWRTRDPRGLDVSAIEHMDARSLALLAEDGADRRFGVALPHGASMALLVTLELPAKTTAADAFDQIGRARDADAPDAPLVRFCRALDDAGVLNRVDIAVPGDEARAAQLLAVREAVPAAVNRRVGRARQTVDPRIEKTAADMIVPFDRFEALLALYRDAFGSRGLDYAVWGHISDGNVHPNVIPRTYADIEAGKAAILDIGRAVVRLGGSPLAEHGVGRNAIKQQLLAELYGPEGIDAMRRVKRAIDPNRRLAPGVILSRD